jgi:hypothetical protein
MSDELYLFDFILENGAPGGIRTPDPRSRNPLLYPLSYGRDVRQWQPEMRRRRQYTAQLANALRADAVILTGRIPSP